MPKPDIVVIPKLYRTYYLTKAQLDALTNVKDGELGYATNENILYRQDGTGAANWVAITFKAPTPTLSWGGTWNNVGFFLPCNGTTAEACVASGNSTRFPVSVAGTIDKASFYHSGNLSVDNATIKIHVNGVVQATLTAVGGAASVDVFTGIGVAVAAGDYVEVEYDAGATIPGFSLFTTIVS